MKKNLLSALFALISTLAISQAQRIVMSYNNISAFVSSDGVFFEDEVNSIAEFRVPKASSNRTIFAFMISAMGTDINGQQHLSSMYYDTLDFTCGPMSDNFTSGYYQSTYANKLWQVDGFTIQQHIDNWDQAGYTMSPYIANWPGNGDTVNGVIEQMLAPYVDFNGNGTYDPANGDYPDIRGDKAVFFVLNDRNNTSDRAIDKLDLELQVMAYEYATADMLNNTFFINVKAVNRGTQTYPDFQLNLFTDFDLGNYLDDFCGTDPERNMAYAYNGDSFDEASGVGMGYGANPPAMGVLSLNHNIWSSTFPQTYPTLAQLSSVYHGFNPNGTPINHGGSPVKMEFTDTISSGGYNEIAETSMPGDRRSFVTLEPVNFQPSEAVCYDLAFVYANRNGGGMWQDVDSLMKAADFIQNFYDASITCPGYTLSLPKQKLQQPELYPNPASSAVYVSGMEADAHVSIADLNGRAIKTQPYDPASGIDVSALAPGSYLLIAETGGTVRVARFMKQ